MPWATRSLTGRDGRDSDDSRGNPPAHGLLQTMGRRATRDRDVIDRCDGMLGMCGMLGMLGMLGMRGMLGMFGIRG